MDGIELTDILSLLRGFKALLDPLYEKYMLLDEKLGLQNTIACIEIQPRDPDDYDNVKTVHRKDQRHYDKATKRLKEIKLELEKDDP